jgi:hypothetical protein
MREGPSYFMIHYKNTSVLRQDPKDAWRVMGSAKFTDNSKELKQWCLDIHDKYSKIEVESRQDTSFASEARRDAVASLAEPEDPTANTKMIT